MATEPWGASDVVGLTEAEAARRLERDGPNELPAEKPRGLLAIAFDVVREPMFLMLVAAGALYLLMGELGDALMLLGFVFVVMGITIAQERRTERALDALKDLSSPRALVIRDGARRRVAGREVVTGDLLVLAEGDRVPADGLVRWGTNLCTDESLLTGESAPVRKVSLPATGTAPQRELDRPGGDDLPSVFSGTLVTAGQAVVEVLATGPRSELGKIGKALHQLEPTATLLQQETRRLVRVFAVVGLAACAVVVLTYGLTRGGDAQAWKQGLLAGIALAMATLPEEFPVILTVFLALGAWRISRSQVLTRRMPAIETLGAATVLCVDKTGTLTQNHMTLRALGGPDAALDLTTPGVALDAAARRTLESAVLASKPQPFDPMERALHEAAARLLGGPVRTQTPGPCQEWPLSPGLLAVTHAWPSPDGVRLACKGAPEAVAGLCGLSPPEHERLSQTVGALASRGLRVLAVAEGAAPSAEGLPASPRALGLRLVGVVGFEDPLRPTVPRAVEECRTAGVRVVMITGDAPSTALSIARQAGLAARGAVMTGPELDALSDEALAARIADVEVFARVVPEQKLRLVNALKAKGEVVAMTGDGVNDAPALKSAHIGIAMGGRGTDVAREAAALVLLDDDFSSIVAAIRLGRRIFDNIKKAVAFVLAVHVPIAGLSLLPVLLPNWPLLLLPVHIVFLELLIDPSCSLVFEAEEAEPDVMRRPPRRPQDRLFSAGTIAVALLQGFSVLAVCVGIDLLATDGHGPDAARALTYVALVVAFLGIILVNRSWTRSAWAMLRRPNAALRWVLLGACALVALVVTVPPVQRLFHFAPLHLDDLALALGAGLGCVLWFELLKWWRTRQA